MLLVLVTVARLQSVDCKVIRLPNDYPTYASHLIATTGRRKPNRRALGFRQYMRREIVTRARRTDMLTVQFRNFVLTNRDDNHHYVKTAVGPLEKS